MMAGLKIGVIGAGVVGVTSALELQNNFRDANVTIIADKYNQDTTSDGAAGIFRPGISFSGPNYDITKKWIDDSYKYYNDLQFENCGVKEISGYIFSSLKEANVRNHYIEKLVPVYRSATQEELKLCPGDWKYGTYYTTLLIECRQFLPWALDKFIKNGGNIVKRTVQKFDELFGLFDVIVNCTGMGARELCNDYKLVPIRGQVIKAKAPLLRNFFYADFDTYVIPGADGIVTMGGCRHYDSYTTAVSRHDTAAILERCESLVPYLKSAEIVREWVGLRPHRDPVRVEIEYRGKHKILHNYGHGGYGVTTAPGTSKYATELLIQSLSSSVGNSKL